MKLTLSLTLLLAVCTTHAQAPAEFDPKVVAAWKGIGAKVGWFQEAKHAWHLYHERKPDQPAMPAIHWPDPRPFEFGLLASMPPPMVPFAFDFNRTRAGARELRELRGFKNLVALNMDGVHLTDADFKEIAPLTGLKTLYVRYAKVSDVGVKELAGLKNLRTIDIGCTKITDDSLKYFANMRDLECMFLQFTAIKGTGCKDLLGLKMLRHIFLGGSATDEGLKEVGKLKHLEYLDLWTARVSDRGLRELTGLTALKNIDLADTQVTDAGMKTLTAIKSLEIVQLYRTKVTDACLKDLGTLPNLRVLCLSKETTSDAAVAQFHKARPGVTVYR
jgi:hypothetical protein